MQIKSISSIIALYIATVAVASPLPSGSQLNERSGLSIANEKRSAIPDNGHISAVLAELNGPREIATEKRSPIPDDGNISGVLAELNVPRETGTKKRSAIPADDEISGVIIEMATSSE